MEKGKGDDQGKVSTLLSHFLLITLSISGTLVARALGRLES